MNDGTSEQRIDRVAIARIASALEHQRAVANCGDRARLVAFLHRISEHGELGDYADDPDAQATLQAFIYADGQAPSGNLDAEPLSAVPAADVAAVLDRLDASEPGSIGSTAVSAEPRYRMAAVGLVFAAIGAVLPALVDINVVIYYFFLVCPVFLVSTWILQAGVVRRPNGIRVPQSAEEWSDELLRATSAIRVRAEQVDDMNLQIRSVTGELEQLRELCLEADVASFAGQVASIGRQVHAAQHIGRLLADLLRDGVSTSDTLTSLWRTDATAACSDFGQMPNPFDSDRVGALARHLMLVLRLCADASTGLILVVQGSAQVSIVGRVSTQLHELFRAAQEVNRQARREWRSTRRAADNLHSTVTVISIEHVLGNGIAKRFACAAAAVSALTRPLRNRATTRTIFVREISYPTTGHASIARATAAAVSPRRARRPAVTTRTI